MYHPQSSTAAGRLNSPSDFGPVPRFCLKDVQEAKGEQGEYDFYSMYFCIWLHVDWFAFFLIGLPGVTFVRVALTGIIGNFNLFVCLAAELQCLHYTGEIHMHLHFDGFSPFIYTDTIRHVLLAPGCGRVFPWLHIQAMAFSMDQIAYIQVKLLLTPGMVTIQKC